MTQEIKDQLDRIEAKLNQLLYSLADETAGGDAIVRIEAKLDAMIQALADEQEEGPLTFVDMDGNEHKLPPQGKEEGLG